MSLKRRLQTFLSFFFPIKLKTYTSGFSGKLFIYQVNGKKILDTSQVNYSYNSLHKVFKKALAHSRISPQQIQRSLILGLGGGSIVSILRTDYKIQSLIIAVEIDPVIIDIAKKEFNIDQYYPVDIIQADADAWVRQNTLSFDLICVDLFINSEVPSIFLSTDFVDQLLRNTNSGGIVCFNIMIVNDKVNHIYQTIYKYLSGSVGKTISSLDHIEVEENNRVLIFKK